MKHILSSLILVLVVLLTANSYASGKLNFKYEWPYANRDMMAETSKSVVVVELFTSETCAFCPNADQYFQDLITKTNVIGLSCHVNFFSNKPQGLALPICTNRQKFYSDRLTGGVKYTPQMIINGKLESVGYYYTTIMDQILAEQNTKSVSKLNIQKSAVSSSYEFQLAINPKVNKADIWLALYGDTVTKQITSGPNRGKTLTYTKPVIALQKMVTWQGDARTIRFNPSLRLRPKGAVVMVQTASGLVAAGEVKF
jgi:hypothetical protein